jgi:glycosyltransferase involved in cell wall biosynthesis
MWWRLIENWRNNRMKNRKVIAFVIPSLHAGGMERVMSELLQYTSTQTGIKVHLILYGKNSVMFYKIPSNISIHKSPLIYKSKERYIFAFKTMKYIRNKIKSVKPDAVLSFGEFWNSFVLLALLRLNFPVYISDRCSPDKSFSRVHDYLRKRFYPLSEGVIAQTSKAKDLYKTQFKHTNVEVIGNPIRSIENSGAIESEKTIITIGRLIDTKHHNRLINIFAKLNAPEWKLVIVGGDAIKQKNSITLQEQIDIMGLSKRVELAGTQKDVESYLLRSKIFAFTSSSEGFPNVIGEALSAGLPVVSYDCVAGPSDMIDDGENGYLVPVFDDVLFQQRLQTLIDNEELRAEMGRKAKESIKRFSVETIGEKYLNFITSKK